MDEFNTYQRLKKESGAQQSVPEKGKLKTLRVNLVRMDIEPSSVSSNYNQEKFQSLTVYSIGSLRAWNWNQGIEGEN